MEGPIIRSQLHFNFNLEHYFIIIIVIVIIIIIIIIKYKTYKWTLKKYGT